MAVEERERRELQEALMEAIGPQQTDTLLGYLPPVGWADVATARDLQTLGAELRGEINELRGEMRGEISGLRGEMRGEINELRGEMRGEIGGLRGELGEFRGELHRELRVQLYWFVALQIATVTIVLTALATGLAG